MRVDFYLLRDTRKTVENVCCLLCAKAFDDGQNVAVLSRDDAQTQHLDQLLWCTPPQRFIPHGQAGTPAARGAAVVIGAISADSHVVINLAAAEHAVPLPPAHQVQRILEIVADDEAARTLARQRYRQYQHHGAQLHTHDLS